jgi:hypothetical protein
MSALGWYVEPAVGGRLLEPSSGFSIYLHPFALVQISAQPPLPYNMRAIALAATAAVVAAQGFGPINNLPVRMLSAFVLALLSPRQLLRFQGSVFTHIMSPHIQHGCLQGWNGTNSMYSGYITVNQTNGRALFFWFIESSVRSIFSSHSNLWQAVSPFYAERPSERPTGLLD